MAVVLFEVGIQQIAHHPRLVGVRIAVFKVDGGYNLRVRWIRDIDDRGAVGRRHVADIGIITVDHDLAAAGDIQAADAFEVSGQGGGLVSH